MRNLRLKLIYDGSAYHGWQVQKNAVTVQGKVEDAAASILGSPTVVYGCSRTDAGVHANEFYCNFRTEKGLDCETIVRAFNAKLPLDIAVLECREMRDSFHSRFDCLSKEYVYKIWNAPLRNPFLFNYAYHYKYKIDEERLDKAAKDFIGTYDFKGFCSSGSSVIDTVRIVTDAGVRREGDTVEFYTRANGFLYNMVRIMVGTLININEGKIDENSIKEIILSGDRERAGVTAPPQGLYLNSVQYTEGDIIE